MKRERPLIYFIFSPLNNEDAARLFYLYDSILFDWSEPSFFIFFEEIIGINKGKKQIFWRFLPYI